MHNKSHDRNVAMWYSKSDHFY